MQKETDLANYFSGWTAVLRYSRANVFAFQPVQTYFFLTMRVKLGKNLVPYRGGRMEGVGGCEGEQRGRGERENHTRRGQWPKALFY